MIIVKASKGNHQMNNAEQSPYGTIAGLVDKRKKRLEYDLFHETQRLLRTDRSKHNSCLENFQLSDPLPLRISESTPPWGKYGYFMELHIYGKTPSFRGF